LEFHDLVATNRLLINKQKRSKILNLTHPKIDLIKYDNCVSVKISAHGTCTCYIYVYVVRSVTKLLMYLYVSI